MWLAAHNGALVDGFIGTAFPVDAQIVEWTCGIVTLLPWIKGRGAQAYVTLVILTFIHLFG
jgi:hypothetical protein